MNDALHTFLDLPTDEKVDVLKQTGEELDILNPIIIEKDFWVCWTLDRLYNSDLHDKILFKGGTSLSKVYGIIERFSEDIDLGIKPEFLGLDIDFKNIPESRNQRNKMMDKMQHASAEYVMNTILPIFKGICEHELKNGSFFFRIEGADLFFIYPKVLNPYPDYIIPEVKLEFGSLTDQEPLEFKPIELMLNKAVKRFDDIDGSVNTLSINRTFWEKATILHRVYNRFVNDPPRKPAPRHSRHYYDFYQLWINTDIKLRALKNIKLLFAVADFKDNFFHAGNANYLESKSGNIRLSPPPTLIPDLELDYKKMRDMFLAAIKNNKD